MTSPESFLSLFFELFCPLWSSGGVGGHAIFHAIYVPKWSFPVFRALANWVPLNPFFRPVAGSPMVYGMPSPIHPSSLSRFLDPAFSLHAFSQTPIPGFTFFFYPAPQPMPRVPVILFLGPCGFFF